MSEQWSTVDPLGEALHFLRMSNAMYARCEFSEPWGLVLPPLENMLMFHVVMDGACWLEVDGADTMFLQPGDLVLVPHGRGHTLSSRLGIGGLGLFDIPREYQSERYEMFRSGGGGAPATLICGAIRYDHPATSHLVNVLPPLIRIEASSSLQAGWIQNTLHFMGEEARDLRPGGEAVLTRLADVLLIQAIRAWIENNPATHTGWLSAIQDQQIGKAMTLIHRDPAHSWTVAELASEVAMSRSAFSSRFTQLVGEPPMHYLARWRMHLAMSGLKEEQASLREVAERVGYRSEAAFSRAFKRVIGVAPGALRS